MSTSSMIYLDQVAQQIVDLDRVTAWFAEKDDDQRAAIIEELTMMVSRYARPSPRP